MLAARYPEAFEHTGKYDAEGNPLSHKILTLLVAPTADGTWLQFSQLQPHLFADFLTVLRLEDVKNEPGWTGLPIYDNMADRIVLLNRMYEAVASMDDATWQRKFEEFPNVFGEAFRKGPEVLEHPQLKQRWISDVSDPEHGSSKQPGRMIRVTGEEDWAPRAPPRVGGDGINGWTSAPAHESWLPTSGQEPDSMAQTHDSANTPLRSITILDLAGFFAAPYGSSVLTDLGARVIHVEQLAGDPIRMAAVFPEIAGMKVMQGKESIAVDIASQEGGESNSSTIGQVRCRFAGISSWCGGAPRIRGQRSA